VTGPDEEARDPARWDYYEDNPHIDDTAARDAVEAYRRGEEP
jgi:hypothetical protein